MPTICQLCNKGPCYGYPGNPALRCKEHAIHGMKNVKNKKCEQCDKQPTFGYPEKVALRCKDHILEGMVDVKIKKCEKNGCTIQCKYGFPGQSPQRCGKHALDGMQNLRHKRCQRGCGKFAQGKTNFCADHGGGAKCASCKQICVASEGMWCYNCRTGTERLKQRELMVKEFLNENSLGSYSYHDETLPCSPSRRRPDFVWVLKDRIVILEVDEDAHRFYNRECEVSRVTELMEQTGGLPLVLIRFNPLKSLLNDVRELLVELLTTTHTFASHLEVRFVGYKQEYDMVQEIETLATKRRHGAC